MTPQWGFPSCPRVDEVLDSESRYGDESTGRTVSHTGTGITRAARQTHETTATKETGARERYIIEILFNNRNMVPVSVRLTTSMSHSTMRMKTTLLSTFGTRFVRYRPSLRLESRISIRVDHFEACLARIVRNATNKKITST